jgi:hypothetical protein
MGKMRDLFTLEQRVAEISEGFFQASEAEQEARRAEYCNELQPLLLKAYGEDALGIKVDPWMAESYSELYKDRYGSRPRGHSYRYMAAWMENVPPLEDFEEEYVEGDRFDPDISTWGSEEDTLERVADYEAVYGVSAMGQAMKFMDIGAEY